MLGWVLRALREQGETLDSVLRTQRTISRHLAAIRHKETDEMATLEDVQALVTQTGVDAQETADRVIAAIALRPATPRRRSRTFRHRLRRSSPATRRTSPPSSCRSVADGLVAVDTTIKGIAPTA